MYTGLFIIGAVFGLVRGQGNQEVAFSVGMSKDMTYTGNERIIYDTIFSNTGAGYDSTSGNFNCPASGIYVFQFHTLAQSDKDCWLELYMNAYYIQSIYAHSGGDYSSAGNSVILKLSKGDQVNIRARDTGKDNFIYGVSDDIYATFSGYMVSAVYEEIPSGGK